MTHQNNSTTNASTPYIPLTIYPLTDSSMKKLPSVEAYGETYRLCEISWKLSEKDRLAGMKKRSAICIPIPTINLTIEPSELSTTVQEAFEELQDSLISKWLNQLLSDNPAYNYLGCKVPLSYTTPSGLSLLASETEKRGKLSAEDIKNWFDEHLAANLAAKILEKNPSIESDEAADTLNRFKNIISSLASAKTMLQKKTAETVKKAVEAANPGRVKMILLRQLEKFINPATVEELEEAI